MTSSIEQLSAGSAEQERPAEQRPLADCDSQWGHAAFWPRGTRWRGLIWIVVIFGAYGGAVVLYPWSTGVALLWLPNAVLVTALLRFRPRDWPFVYAAAIPAEIVGDLMFNMPTYQALGLGVVNLVEATAFVLVAWLIAGGRQAIGLLSVRGAAALVLASVAIPALTGALGGAIVESAAAFGAEYFTAWRTWWFGDSLGLLVGVPIGLLLRDARRSAARRQRSSLAILGGGAAALLMVVSVSLAVDGITIGAQQTALTAAVVLSLAFGAVGAPIAAVTATTVTLISLAQVEDLDSVVSDQTLLVVVLAAIYAIAATTESAARALDQLSRAKNALALLSRTDELTGMSNRRVLSENLDHLWAWCARESKPVAMLMVDIDFFHRYNATYGHLAGDSVIRRIASVIKRAGSRRLTDLVIRYGGEEFLMVLPDATLDYARKVADRIHEGIADLNIEHSNSPVAPRVTVSIGALAQAKATPGAETQALELCDSLLFKAKESGRNRTVIVQQ